MAKKTQKRKIVRLAAANGAVYYTTVRSDGRTRRGENESKKLELRKYNPKTRQHEVFKEVNKNLGRNEVKKRK